MTRSGDRLTNPITRHALVFRVTSAESRGALVEVESIYGAGSAEPPLHFHPEQTERFEVLDGEVQVRIDGSERILGPGGILEIPPGKPHAMWNAGPAEARVVWQTRPALGTQTFFETVWGLAADGRVGPSGFPRPLQMAVLVRAYRREIRLTHPAAWVQTLLLTPLAGLGYLCGCRGRYERYSGPPARFPNGVPSP